MRQHKISSQTFKIITQYGDMLVVRQGVQPHHHHHYHHHHHLYYHHNASSSGQQAQTQQPHASENQQQQQSTSRPIIMTFHDLGLNSELQFATFCECDEVKLMLQTFTMIHVNFIGQEFELNGQAASSLPEDFKYPTVEQMAECIVDICAQLRVRSFIALAVGAGAHIVSSLALLRPDLVHGLFLINPVLSSCSLSEWLCFKMSAIASNQPLVGSSSHGHTHSSPSREKDDPDGSQGSPDGHQHSSGLRKLWNRVHHHHHHAAHSRPSSTHLSISSKQASISTDSPSRQSTVASDERLAAASDEPNDERAAGLEPPTGGPQASIASGAKPAASYRLRQLILSRNFRMGKQHMLHQEKLIEAHQEGSIEAQRGQRVEPKEATRWQHHKRRQSVTNSIDTQMDDMEKRSEPLGARNSRRRFSGGASSLTKQPPVSPTGRANKRPPVEYLMYHHFGSASFQRFRRPSASSGASETSGPPAGDTESLASQAAGSAPSGDSEGSTVAAKQHRLSCSSSGSGQSQSAAASASVAANMMMRRTHRNSRDSNPEGATTEDDSANLRLADSPAHSTSQRSRHARAHRSSSVCLTAQHLGSFANERQRIAYMQMVYKQYFTQINAHNLWLFAQSFIKRHTLNLRKDCGAAAHAAAAAAALGTSICAAFVGIGPAPATNFGDQSAAGDKQEIASSLATARCADEKSAGAAKVAEIRPQQQQKQKEPSSDKQQAVVAGTKVKRTFTCQTLIMCSSVQIHCDRALKLMSLLNPLQATWIKTDQMLVLEEKPEKVCQALRLFLQGIGYSMSTYERRLRLNSAQASFSSADSNGSARSLTDPTTAAASAGSQIVQPKPMGPATPGGKMAA